MQIWLSGKAVGKARPRFSSRTGAVHTEGRYGQWKRDATLQIRALNLSPIQTPVRVDCLFVNFGSSDSDNLIGSVLDVLVGSGVLQNDSSGFVVGSSGTFTKSRKRRNRDKPVGILIRITPAQIEYLDFDITDIAPQSVA